METKKLLFTILCPLILWGVQSCTSSQTLSSGSTDDDMYATEQYQKPQSSKTPYVTPVPVPANGNTSIEEYTFASSDESRYPDNDDENYISPEYQERMARLGQKQKQSSGNSLFGPSTSFGVASGSYGGVSYTSWNMSYGFSNGLGNYGSSSAWDYNYNPWAGWNPSYMPGYNPYCASSAYSWNNYYYNPYGTTYSYDPYYGYYSPYPSYGAGYGYTGTYYGGNYYNPYSGAYYNPFSYNQYYNNNSYYYNSNGYYNGNNNSYSPPVNTTPSGNANNTNPRAASPGSSYQNNNQNQYSNPNSNNNNNYGNNNSFDNGGSSYQNNPRPSSPGSSYDVSPSYNSGGNNGSYGGSNSGGGNPRTDGAGGGSNNNKTYQPIRR